MSRRRNNNKSQQKPVLEEEYKDSSIVEKNMLEEEDYPVMQLDNPSEFVDQGEEALEIEYTEPEVSIVLKHNTYIRTQPNNDCKVLTCRQLTDKERSYCQGLPHYSLAMIKKDTTVTCTPLYDNWYRIENGFIYNGEENPNKSIGVPGKTARYRE